MSAASLVTEDKRPRESGLERACSPCARCPLPVSAVAGCDGSDDGAVAVSARHVLVSPSQSKRLEGQRSVRVQRWVALWGSAFKAPFAPLLRAACGGAARRLRALKERKKTDNPREGWEDGTPPPHRDF